ncbi:MAG: cobalamin biosynthesis protein CobQ [Methylothermaceae bacteria B42]|nr:MAG: cobalamin biosynthesis protein CobQ [Methylothermaceae bacteria B42]HHJ37890.1 ParA family protein [Methylothermaceae bacterium]
MQVWAISNQKGGVGKTTTVATLAGLLQEQGARVLMVDLDPHGSLSSYFEMSPEKVEHGVYDLFRQAMGHQHEENPENYIQSTAFDNLSLLPAVMALATVERQAGAIEGLGLVLQKALERLRGKFDYVLVDTPPMLGVLMVNALAACDRLIVPVMAEYLSLQGLERMLRTLAMISRSRKRPFDYTIVPTLFDRRTRVSSESLKLLQERHGDCLWSGVIPVDTKLREASEAHLPVSQYYPNSRAAIAYEQLLEFLLESSVSDEPQALSA